MACDVTRGRGWKCKDSTGGIKAVYFANYGDLTGLTVTNGVISSGFTSGITLYKYDLPEYTGSLTQNITPSTENGTIFFEQVLELVLHKLEATDRDEIKLLAAGRPHVIVVDNNDNQLLLGFQKGCDVTSGSMQTGTAGGDLSGYNLTFTGREVDGAPFVTEDISNATIVNS